jgi:peptidoglycan/LPS O-acetylase OafA/YrhL
MTEPWFDPNQYAWIPGTAYGIAAGLMGGLVGWLVPRGRARTLIVRAWFTLWAAAVALLIVGMVAWAQGQPWGVWYGLVLPGVIGTLVVGANSIVIVKKYRELEDRRLAAKDLL